MSCSVSRLEIVDVTKIAIDIKRICERRPKPECPPLLYTLQYDNLLTFLMRFPVLCNCAMKSYIMSWFYQNVSSLVLNQFVVLADTAQLDELLHVLTTLFEKSNVCGVVILCYIIVKDFCLLLLCYVYFRPY